MSDTERLRVVLEAQNLTQSAFQQMRRDVEAAGVSVESLNTRTVRVSQETARAMAASSREVLQAQQALQQAQARVPAATAGGRFRDPQSGQFVGGAQAAQLATAASNAEANLKRVEEQALRTARSATELRQTLQGAVTLPRSDVSARQTLTRDLEAAGAASVRLSAINEETARRQIAANQRVAESAKAAADARVAAEQVAQRQVAAITQVAAGGGAQRQVVSANVLGASPQQLRELQQLARAAGAEWVQLGQHITRTGQAVASVRIVPGTRLADPAALQGFERALQGLTLEGVRFTTVVPKMTAQTEQLHRAITLTSGAVQGLGHGLGLFTSFGAGVGIAVLTNAIVSFGRESVGVFAEFERNVRGANALLGLAGDVGEQSFQQLEQGAREMGVALGTGATAQAKGLYEVLSAGVTTSRDAFQVLEVGSKAAVASMSDVSTAVDGITSVLNAYKLTAADAEKVSDQMFQTVNIGKITFDQLASSIGTVAPIAAALGVSFGEVGGLIANATQQGLRAGQSIEGLRAAMNSALKPSLDAQQITRALNVEWNASAIRTKGFTQAVSDLVTALGGSEELLSRVFGDVQAVNFAFTLAAANQDAARRSINGVTTATKTSSAAFDEMEKSTARALERSGARFEELRVKIARNLVVPLEDLLVLVQQVGERLGAWPTEVPSAGQVERFERMRDSAEKLAAVLDFLFRDRGEFGTPTAVGAAVAEKNRRDAEAVGGALQQAENAAARFQRAVSESFIEGARHARSLREIIDDIRTRLSQPAGQQGGQQGEQQATAAVREHGASLKEIMAIDRERTQAQQRNTAEVIAAADAELEATKRAKEEQTRLHKLAEDAQKDLQRIQEQAPQRAEQDALQRLRQQVQDANQAAQRQAEQAIAGPQARLDAIRDAADAGSEALDEMRDAATRAGNELDKLKRTAIEGSNAFQQEQFDLGQRSAANQLVIEQARLARLNRQPIDRAAVRAAALDDARATQEARISALQEQTQLGGQRRQLELAAAPPREAPFADLLARTQAARAAQEQAEGPDRERIQEAEDEQQRLQREARAIQRQIEQARRAGTARIDTQREAGEAVIRQAEAIAEAAERARDAAQIKKLEEAIRAGGLPVPEAPPTTAADTIRAASARLAGTPLALAGAGGRVFQLTVQPGAVQVNGEDDAAAGQRLQDGLNKFLEDFVASEVATGPGAGPTAQGARR